jgi:glucokinase
LETEVSAQKIILNYQKTTGSKHPFSSKEIYQKAQQGDKNAIEAFSEAGRFLGIGIAIAINLLNPDKIIIGGGVMNAADLLLPPAHEEAQRRSYRAAFDCCTIEQATLGNQAGFIGAACWAKDNLNL